MLCRTAPERAENNASNYTPEGKELGQPEEVKDLVLTMTYISLVIIGSLYTTVEVRILINKHEAA